MFFNNALVYSFTKSFNLSAEELEEHLINNKFTPCLSNDVSKQGWASAIPNTESLVLKVNNFLLVRLATEEKILPSSVVKDALDEKISAIEAERGQKVGKKEKTNIKEEIVSSLLPKAFTKNSSTWAYIDTTNQNIVVNASSASKAESLLAMLRQSIGTLPVLPLKPDTDLMIGLTEMVKSGHTPEKLAFGTSIALESLSDENSKAKLSNFDIQEDDVKFHLENGLFVESMQFVYDEKIRFELNSLGHIKKIKFMDIVKEQTDDIPADDVAAKFDADVSIMAGELSELIIELNKYYVSLN